MFQDRYTEQMENRLFSQWEAFDSGEEDYSAVINLLNDPTCFHTFGDSLLAFMKKRFSNLTDETAIKHIENACLENGIGTSEIGSTNTLKNWFKGGPRPKKGTDSRKAMFALAFALQLTPDETSELFHKVYLDRAFNYRNEKELIYYYCLNNRKTWQDAQKLIAQITADDSFDHDHTVYTSIIKDSVDAFSSETDLLCYITRHRHNFEQSNVTAKETLAKLLTQAKGTAKAESLLPEHAEQYRGSNRDSINFMYEVITGFSVANQKGTTTIFKNARLPKEIKSRFPEAGTFSKKAPTYEELRKMIVLLFSYHYWYQVQTHGVPSDIDNYADEVNVYLSNSGLPLLYYGNPFDWLFLYCNLSDRPLDTFREILSEVLED